MKIRYILSLLTVAFLLGSCATPKVAYFTDLKRGTAEQVLNPLGNPDTSRRQDFHTGQQQRPLINEPFQPSDHIPDRLVRHQVHPIVREYQDIQ